ncbi:MAG TPA: nucleotidyl transferase AbiEii/AbiGii toxin family protein, partial [Burkholderiales bacterium]|nr:nucleotidyl transferase AbiEii/AbiGii toxin family protein [Burkholderiales bacterium]
MTAAREGLARSVQVRLARHAKEIGVDPNLVLTRYAVERFLYRLSRSAHAERFVLKGALLLLVWLGETLRPTRDADLLGFGELPDDSLVTIFREVCGVEVELDAATFLPDSVRVAPIREEDAYGGRRVTLQARVGAARLTVQADIGIGDAVTPEPQWLEYPSLLDLPRPRLRAYPRETVLAEKLHAMVLLGARNSRMKDYFDVRALLREEKADTEQLARAIAATFARRRTAVPEGIPTGLSDGFASDAAKQAQWRAFLANNRI